MQKLKQRFKKGESLIEVLIATTIFSTIAVSAIGAVRANLNYIQGALENTIAQAEIDAQSEALRFIQENYLADSSNEFYKALWEKISSFAILTDDVDKIQADYDSTSSPYDEGNNFGIKKINAFIINTRLLSSKSEEYYMSLTNDPNKTAAEKAAYIEKIIVPASSGVLKEASSYPRLIYSDDSGNSEEDNGLISYSVDSENFTNLKYAEGIWIVGVATEAAKAGSESAAENYIDFYIRTYWNTVGFPVPNNVATGLRISDPAALDVPKSRLGNIKIRYNYNYNESTNTYQTKDQGVIGVEEGNTQTFYIEEPPQDVNVPNGYFFTGWSDNDTLKHNGIGEYCDSDMLAKQQKEGNGSCKYDTKTVMLEKVDQEVIINLYAVVKPKIVVAILIDTTTSMTPIIQEFKQKADSLIWEIVHGVGGTVRVYTSSNNLQYYGAMEIERVVSASVNSNPEINKVYQDRYPTTPLNQNYFEDDAYDDLIQIMTRDDIAKTLWDTSESDKRMIIVLTDTNPTSNSGYHPGVSTNSVVNAIKKRGCRIYVIIGNDGTGGTPSRWESITSSYAIDAEFRGKALDGSFLDDPNGFTFTTDGELIKRKDIR